MGSDDRDSTLRERLARIEAELHERMGKIENALHILKVRLQKLETRFAVLTERLSQWMKSVERRLEGYTSTQRWALGVLTTLAVGLVVALLTRGL